MQRRWKFNVLVDNRFSEIALTTLRRRSDRDPSSLHDGSDGLRVRWSMRTLMQVLLLRSTSHTCIANKQPVDETIDRTVVQLQLGSRN